MVWKVAQVNRNPVSSKQIDRQQWQLLGCALSITVALILGLVSFAISPAHQTAAGVYWDSLRQWVCALAAFVFVFNIYAIYQQVRFQRLRKELRERDQVFELIAQNAPDMIAVVDTESHRLYNSPTYQHVLGYSVEELSATSSLDQIHPDDRQRVVLAAEKARERGLGERIEYRMRHKDGSWRTLESTACAIQDAQGWTDKLVIVNRDVTERKRTEELLVHNEALRRAEEKYRSIFEDAVIGLFQITIDGRPLDVNFAMAQINGYSSPEQFIGEISSVFTQLFVDAPTIERLLRVLDEQSVVRGTELETKCRDGTRKWAMINMRAICDSNGDVVLYEGTLEDITDRKLAEGKAQYLAYYDALTGLANRTLLQDRLSKALASSRRRNDKVALLFLDLDRFKVINDSFGHSFGDLLLQEVAKRLTARSREQDTVARVSGDEFVIVLTGMNDATDVAVAGERIMDAMNTEFIIEGHPFNVSCSLGISVFPDHGADNEALIKSADAAMYSAKENGRNNLHVFSQEMNAQAAERLTLEQGLRSAIDKNELFLMYQPQMEISTGAIIGLEALLRWQHPKLGTVSPDRFMRIAENSGLILPIGTWVLKTACSQIRKWHDENLFALPVAVNVSAVQFRQQGFRELVSQVLVETGLSPKYLELELTESLLLSTADMTSSLLRQLKNMGLELTIDDFGTGYSSLSYLKKFPFGKLKIDRSFIRGVAANSDDAAITTAIISLAKSLSLKVIAEGVENEAQLLFLRALRCDEIQGYYVSKPLTTDEIRSKFGARSAERSFSAANRNL